MESKLSQWHRESMAYHGAYDKEPNNHVHCLFDVPCISTLYAVDCNLPEELPRNV